MLQKQINADFLTAYKNKETEKKDALSLLKGKISDELRESKKTELTDDEVTKIVTKQVKQLKTNISEYQKGNRQDLVNKETYELNIISSYLPKPFTDTELMVVLESLSAKYIEGNVQRRIGQTIGEFNKLYPGKANIDQVKTILTNIVI